MKFRLAFGVAALTLSLSAPAFAADLKYPPGEGPFHWENFEALKKIDLLVE